MAENFWDHKFYNFHDQIEDRETIYKTCPEKLAMVHYISVESLILKYIYSNSIKLDNILDIGSGSGHWIEFYSNLYPYNNIVGVDISSKIYKFLTNKYKDNPKIDIYNNINDVPPSNKFTVINAIGVMFHIINDRDFENMISILSNVLNNNGIMIIGGEFGDKNEFKHKIWKNTYIKKTRSLQTWEHILSKHNLYIERKIINPIRKHFNTPENNLLIIKKRCSNTTL